MGAQSNLIDVKFDRICCRRTGKRKRNRSRNAKSSKPGWRRSRQKNGHEAWLGPKRNWPSFAGRSPAKAAAAEVPIPEENWNEALTRAFVSTSCWLRLAGISTGPTTRNSRSKGCRPLTAPTTESVTSTTSCGVTTGNRWRSSSEESDSQHRGWPPASEAVRTVSKLPTGDRSLPVERLPASDVGRRPLCEPQCAGVPHQRRTGASDQPPHQRSPVARTRRRHRHCRALHRASDPKVAESFDEGHRKSLLVMATGADKTRTTSRSLTC